MKSVSEQYKQAMQLQIRNRSTMVVAIGDVDINAQTSAKPTYRNKGAYYSKTEGIFKGHISDEYSTLEENFTRADGSMMFLPRETDDALLLDVGFVGEEVVNGFVDNASFAIDFTPVPAPFNITLDFGEHNPRRLAVFAQLDNGQEVMVLTTFSNVYRRVTATLSTMPSGATAVVGVRVYGGDTIHRFRIKEVVMGKGLLLFPDIIESTEQKNYCSRIDEELPTADLTINLINYESRYDADNPKNPLAILDSGDKEINVYYGYDVDGNETYEWVHGCKLISAEWESSTNKATIHAHDILQNDERLYIHDNARLGRYHNALFWLEDIFQAMGISDYVLDADIDDIDMTLSIIKTYPMKEMLQLIANYCCKTLYINGDGQIVISDKVNTTYDETELATDTVVVDTIAYENTYSGETETEYDKVEARIHYTGTDTDIIYFDEVEYDGVEFTYNFFSRYGNGTYAIEILGYENSDTPKFEITSDDIINDIKIEKEDVVKDVVVPYYSAIAVPIEKTVVNNETVTVGYMGADYYVSFGDTIYGDIEVEITSTTNMVSASDFTQGSISGTTGQNTPSTNRLRSYFIEVEPNTTYRVETQSDLLIYEIYEYEDDETFISYFSVNDTVAYFTTGEDTGNIRLLLRRPENEDVTPDFITEISMKSTTQSSGFAPTDYFYMYLPNEGEYEITISASSTMQYVSNNVTYNVNPTGKVLTWNNPLIGSEEVAQRVAEFVGDYLRSNLSYNYEYRGNPELETSDIVKQENDFTYDMQVVITEHTIKFNGGLDGEITARRWGS